MLILNAQEVRQALPMVEAIPAMKRAYAALSGGRAEIPLRLSLPVPPYVGVVLFMPGFVKDEQGEALAVKVVSVFNKNPERGLPLIYAAVLVMRADTGQPVALLEGSSLTAIRTGAGSGAAIDLLARPDSRVAAIFGAGAQGRTQLEAVCTIRRIETAYVYDVHPERAAALVEEMAGRGSITKDLRLAPKPKTAVASADIICTATTSMTPVFADTHLKPGVHISAVGSYTPEMQEIPAETVARARVVVDSRSATLAESGDLIQPLRTGLFSEDHIYAEIGEILLGRKPGRQNPHEITLFISVGVAVQDAMAAQLALQNADKMGIGQKVAW